MNKILFLLVACLFISFPSQKAEALSLDNRWVNPITDICWNCLFPLTIGNIDITGTVGMTDTDSPIGSTNPDTPNPSSPIQICQMGVGYRVGLAVGFWEPMAMTDVTPQPGNMVNMGFKIDLGTPNRGTESKGHTTNDRAFYHVHWYKYPLISWLNVLTYVGCMQSGDMDIGYMSELDPTWDDDQTAGLINPEVFLVDNPVSQVACAADSMSALVSSPIDSLYWCAGSQGSMYPLTGTVANDYSPLQVSTLLSERTDFKLHRAGAILDSIGVNSAVCYTYYSAIMPKSRYRYEQVNIIPDANACHPFGRATILWETGHNTPVSKNNFGYLIWRKRNCVLL